MTEMTWTKASRWYCPSGLAGNVPFVRWMAKHLDDGLMVDCGANVGAVCVATLLAAKPGARAVAFEPQTRVANVLEKLAAANGVNVELHRTAVSSFVGTATLQYPVERYISGWASIADEPVFEDRKKVPQQRESEVVSVTTLDVWWVGAGKPDVRLVKIDCQGAEPDILEGGKALFATVPFLFIEKHGPTLAEHGHSVGELLATLDALGFQYEPANRNNLYCRKDE